MTYNGLKDKTYYMPQNLLNVAHKIFSFSYVKEFNAFQNDTQLAGLNKGYSKFTLHIKEKISKCGELGTQINYFLHLFVILSLPDRYKDGKVLMHFCTSSITLIWK